MLMTKDPASFFQHILSPGDEVICVPFRPNVSWQHAIPPHALARIAMMICPLDSCKVKDALEIETRGDRITIITGSFHLCGQILKKESE